MVAAQSLGFPVPGSSGLSLASAERDASQGLGVLRVPDELDGTGLGHVLDPRILRPLTSQSHRTSTDLRQCASRPLE